MEKEKQASKTEVEEARAQTESVQKAQANAAKLAKQLEHQIQELNARIDEAGRQASEANSVQQPLHYFIPLLPSLTLVLVVIFKINL